jgi:predicted alpha-1,6-mannanase (GH76 family)
LAFNWSFAHAFAAALDVYAIGGRLARVRVDDLVAGLYCYWDNRPHTGVPAYSSTVVKRLDTGAKYYDDNAWSGLNLMRLYRMDPSRTQLVAQSSAVLQFALDDHRRQQSGAIHWQQQLGNASRELGTVANAANTQLALRLHLVTRDPQLLDDALSMCAWVNEYLRDPSTTLFWDHVTPPEYQLDTTQWSYNQGLMIGVNALLYQATGEVRYRRESVAIADSSLALFDLTRLQREPAEFAVILFRNLFLLTSVEDDARLAARIRRRAVDYLQLLLPRFVRDVDTGDVDTGDDEPARLIEQAAIVEMIAMSCWPTDRYDLLV